MNELQKDNQKYEKKRDLYKALKRLFSLYRLQGASQSSKIDTSLDRLFNFQVGFLNKCKGDLKIILVLLKQTFRKPLTADISTNLMRIKENLHSLDSIDLKTKLIDSRFDCESTKRNERGVRAGH